MSTLDIISAGIATSIQDAGRFGMQRYGLAPSGAMDRLALAAANCLVGNSAFAPAIEIGPQGAVVTVRDGPLRVAVTGALRALDIDGHGKRLGQTITLEDGERLTLGMARDGIFGYLAIQGGIAATPVFGSCSVNAYAGLGSPYPRALQNGDRLTVNVCAAWSHERTIDLPSQTTGALGVVMGPQADEFADACELFLNSQWRVSASSNRMGYRLEGPALKHLHGYNIVSDGTVDGSIQVAGNGQPIVLMKDRGTTGGYPKIATVISADLGWLAQTRFGRTIRFEALSIEDAQARACAFHDLIRSLPDRIRSVA
ncbi:MAG: biotin-dependent carboxyltransferase family protein [Afipia sp.]|nr:biotin-dependent carboxyltransferase family protein [Afipia sp.]